MLLDIKNCCSSLRVAYLSGMKYAIIRNSKRVRNFLQILQQFGLITDIHESFKSARFLVCHLNRANTLIHSLQCYDLYGGGGFLSYATIAKYLYASPLVIVASSKGFLTLPQVYKYRVGGALVAYIPYYRS
jgi:ribosomal protein S8